MPGLAVPEVLSVCLYRSLKKLNLEFKRRPTLWALWVKDPNMVLLNYPAFFVTGKRLRGGGGGGGWSVDEAVTKRPTYHKS